MSEVTPGFSDLLGHDELRARLQAAARGDRLAHALLFAGADGIGKRSFALALSAWLLCEQPGEEACGECSSCRQMAAGSHPDFKLVGLADKKKEIGVDRAREIKRFTQLRPARGAMKFTVVDTAHALNQAAQNALLKTLEDPPRRSILILVANNPDALLATVRSRCQRINFQPLAPDLVRDVLLRQGVDRAAAQRLAEVAEGSPGRALDLQRHLSAGVDDLAAPFAALAGARYVDLMQTAATLTQPEDGLAAKLELLLAQIRDRAAAAANSGDDLQVTRWLQRGEIVAEAADLVRHRSPNRQLLLDSLMLRLAKA